MPVTGTTDKSVPFGASDPLRAEIIDELVRRLGADGRRGYVEAKLKDIAAEWQTARNSPKIANSRNALDELISSMLTH